jgi:hypothetical protein
MDDYVNNAATLMGHIRKEIDDCSPVATIEEVFYPNGRVYFFIQTGAAGNAVIITKLFLDADGGVDHALNALTGLGDALKNLDPGHVLEVSQDGVCVSNWRTRM